MPRRAAHDVKTALVECVMENPHVMSGFPLHVIDRGAPPRQNKSRHTFRIMIFFFMLFHVYINVNDCIKCDFGTKHGVFREI